MVENTKKNANFCTFFKTLCVSESYYNIKLFRYLKAFVIRHLTN